MSNIIERKEVTILIVAISFILSFFPYFFDIPGLMTFSTKLTMIVSIINAFTILLALYAQTRRILSFVGQRTHGWPYQLWTLILLYLSGFIGLALGQSSPTFLFFQYAFLMPAGAVQYSILTFYMASAGMKAFRARSPQATVLIIAGILVLLGQAPLTGAYVPIGEDIKAYLMENFARAAAKMFSISLVVGGTVLGVRILLGKEEQAIGYGGGGG
jgi:hypothetical protein